jgi:hypothetical protein
MTMKKITWTIGAAALAILLAACEPVSDPEVVLPSMPEPPTFSWRYVEGDSNRVVVTDNSAAYFSRVWSFPGGFPERSSDVSDTVFFRLAGEYTITLHAAASGGAGVASASQQLTIPSDAVQGCSDIIEKLAGGCDDDDYRCWTFSNVAAAIAVGPTPGSTEWYTSPVNGLQEAQYDDGFCFYFKDSRFVYANNGTTVDPWNGYVPVPFDPPANWNYTLIPGGGENGELRIELPTGAFMGVWDASNIYDVVSITDEQLIVRTPFLNGGGWFQLIFVSN